MKTTFTTHVQFTISCAIKMVLAQVNDPELCHGMRGRTLASEALPFPVFGLRSARIAFYVRTIMRSMGIADASAPLATIVAVLLSMLASGELNAAFDDDGARIYYISEFELSKRISHI